MELNQLIDMEKLKEMKVELTRFMMSYKFACDEINTKINILSEEFNHLHDYNPIEHVKSRVKSPESIFKKLKRKNYELSLESIKENIRDIAGIRITCSFRSDIYTIADMLTRQKDITVIECKDYIKNPKPNGYQSLHMIVQVPIFMTDRTVQTYVEIQIRTIAMDFWASLEHKIYYKYNKDIPAHLKEELQKAAFVATQMDQKMEWLHNEVSEIKKEEQSESDFLMEELEKLPPVVLEALSNYKNSLDSE